ncbi:unnamed protein product [Didymodactylos carnosus]|uniref:Uncharacterized protein n=2 Tax=Didymodactylos carnosus TaxID=1234261 RepID=A0A814MDH7_9BILA|nr:unnamed protein product [Didymodactylos carnosus]CAF3843000.1 unnamed protein product [Didymodactylos carnosus]
MYPMEPECRYRCLNSTLYVSLFQLYDCNTDCPNEDDDNMMCPWINDHYYCYGTMDKRAPYLCQNDAMTVPVSPRCHGQYGCDHGEDERYCDLIDVIDKDDLRYFTTTRFNEHVAEGGGNIIAIIT